MIRVQLEFVIIALVHEKLEKNEDVSITISAGEVIKWGGKMEEKFGMAILNDFRPDEIVPFLRQSQYFREGKVAFSLNEDALVRFPDYPNITACLFEALNPRLNYPMELLRETGLLSSIENK